MKPVEKGGAPPGFRLDGAALWRACGVTVLQAARELNSASSDLESKPIPDRDLESEGSRVPVIAMVVGHHCELPTCARALAIPAGLEPAFAQRALPVRSRAL